ncbi:MAG TPA: 5-carboxymethyl-2-hydroxymuconate Delta-isomerase [Acidobacteriota bacterium]
MPHLTLEYSANLSPAAASDQLFARLHALLAEVGGIRLANCKSRARELSRCFVAAGSSDAGFVHLDVRFMEGRTPEVKQRLGWRLLEALRQAYGADERAVQITVEIRDIAKADYFKYPEGTLSPSGAQSQ